MYLLGKEKGVTHSYDSSRNTLKPKYVNYGLGSVGVTCHGSSFGSPGPLYE